MKSTLKFFLLFGLIVAGKLTKQSEPTAVAVAPRQFARPDSVLLVNQVQPNPTSTAAVPVKRKDFLASF
jgi:hypothetical protein